MNVLIHVNSCPVYLIGYTPHKYVYMYRERRAIRHHTPTIMPRGRGKKKKQTYPDPRCRKTTTHTVEYVEIYVITCYLYYHIYARQMKSNSLKSGESKSSCSKLTLHSFQSENSWLRFDGQTVNCLNICINPLLLYKEGVPPPPPKHILANRPYLWPKIITSNPHLNLPLAFMLWFTELA